MCNGRPGRSAYYIIAICVEYSVAVRVCLIQSQMDGKTKTQPDILISSAWTHCFGPKTVWFVLFGLALANTRDDAATANGPLVHSAFCVVSRTGAGQTNETNKQPSLYIRFTPLTRPYWIIISALLGSTIHYHFCVQSFDSFLSFSRLFLFELKRKSGKISMWTIL